MNEKEKKKTITTSLPSPSYGVWIHRIKNRWSNIYMQSTRKFVLKFVQCFLFHIICRYGSEFQFFFILFSTFYSVYNDIMSHTYMHRYSCDVTQAFVCCFWLFRLPIFPTIKQNHSANQYTNIYTFTPLNLLKCAILHRTVAFFMYIYYIPTHL